VPESWAALTDATVPTKLFGATPPVDPAVEEELGAAIVTVGRVVEPVAEGRVELDEVVVAEFVLPTATRGELEHEASSPQEKRHVPKARVRLRPGRRTVAHHSRGPASVMLGLAPVLVFVLASCATAADQDGARRAQSHVALPTTATGVTTVPPTVPTTVPPTVPSTVPTTVSVVTTAPKPAPKPVPTTAAHAPAPAPPLLVTRLVGVGSATQVIAVSASGYGQTLATLTAYQLDTTGWHQVFGPWQANVGYAGFAPPGQKREGDGRTPSGSFGFDFFFGVSDNPGVQFPFRAVTGRNIVWDDDPSSPLYNQWLDTSVSNAGTAPEPMDQVPAYDYGAVIAYNMDPTVPGVGSAIFLHVSTGAATTGCVSLPTAELLAVLRWLSPAAQPRIIMGTAATISP